ncbi:hypothetical protein JWV37_02995 [Sulfurospirillum sp. T05]|uniref:Lipoprotein n=1 Tax=Sulfurospirillum tamanense TaxID=2813362 RepID=A0ABS2WPV8_9BACT|nr:hypothetical protein [Sulfurospirillum tamanensis]MBN2963736.1 hypothetical protein [Sulfurospirillum tamanensis]
MKKALILILFALTFQGCLYLNDRGVSTRYYNDCKEYYDSMGVYRKTCDDNLVDFSDLNPKKLRQ